jgi:tetratricopeptide (TPR) repeat protein
MSSPFNSQNSIVKLISKLREGVLRDLYAGKLDYEKGIRVLGRQLEVAQRAKSDLLVGQIYSTMGIVEWYRGNMDKALARFQDSLTAFQADGSDENVAIAFMNIGEVHRERGNVTEAVEAYQKARVVAEKSENFLFKVTLLTNEGQLWLGAGELDKGMGLLENALQLIEKHGWTEVHIIRTISEIENKLAEGHARKGDWEKAKTLVEHALKTAQEYEHIPEVARAYYEMAFIGILHPVSGYDVPGCLAQSREHWQKTESIAELGRVWMLEGDYWKSKADTLQAKIAYQNAVAYFEKAELTTEAAQAREKVG